MVGRKVTNPFDSRSFRKLLNGFRVSKKGKRIRMNLGHGHWGREVSVNTRVSIGDNEFSTGLRRNIS